MWETRIRYSDELFFEVAYQPKKMVWRLIFSLERQLERLRKASAVADDGEEFDEEDREDTLAFTDSDTQTQIMTTLQHQAKLLVTGDQHNDVDLPYLVDSLRIAYGKPPPWDSVVSQEDQTRVSRLRAILQRNSSN
jgi:hypothetical protein